MSGKGQLDVCLATLRYYPVYAGPAIRFRRYAPGLARRGIGMKVLTVDPQGTTKSEGGGADWTHGADAVDGVPVYRVPIDGWSDLRAELALARGLVRYSKQVSRPDVVQLLSLSRWSLPWLYRLRRSRVPVVFTRTMIRDPSVPAYKHLPMVPAYRLLDCVVVSTGVMRDSLREEGIRGRVEVIPNGIDLQRFRPLASQEERTELRRKLGFDADAELIVFIGGFLSERKGVDVLAEAWRILAPNRPRATLLLVGPEHNTMKPDDPQKAFLDRVEASLNASGARDRVVLTGPVENVGEYLQVADVFVFPSRREGMPNVVPEAFACGAASVLTPFIGLPTEFGRAGEHFVLSDPSAEGLARSIEALLDNPARRSALAGAARAWVERELDVERSLDSYAALYRELAGVANRR